MKVSDDLYCQAVKKTMIIYLYWSRKVSTEPESLFMTTADQWWQNYSFDHWENLVVVMHKPAHTLKKCFSFRFTSSDPSEHTHTEWCQENESMLLSRSAVCVIVRWGWEYKHTHTQSQAFIGSRYNNKPAETGLIYFTSDRWPKHIVMETCSQWEGVGVALRADRKSSDEV